LWNGCGMVTALVDEMVVEWLWNGYSIGRWNGCGMVVEWLCAVVPICPLWSPRSSSPFISRITRGDRVQFYWKWTNGCCLFLGDLQNVFWIRV
jgi:hypothetical protein